MDIKVLFEDSHILVCEKPAGVPAQTGRTGTPDMESILKNRIFEKNPGRGEPYLAMIHRLDQPVQGIMVFGKTPFAARELSRQVNDGTMKKFYMAVTCGRMPVSEGKLEDYLVKNGRENTSSVAPKSTPGAKKAELNYRVIETGSNGTNLVEIELITGRHHQIRVQMSNAGAPLWGDTKYNPDFAAGGGWSQIALSAYRLTFRHPKTKELMTFTTVPEGKGFEGCEHIKTMN